MLTHFHKIFCAICACLSVLSKGAGFGFPSQLTYSLKHGYDDKIEVTTVDISWMGIKLYDNIARCLFIKWFDLGAISCLGSILGFFGGGWASQYIGKRIIMVLCNFVCFISWVILALFANKVELIILVRFFIGAFSAASYGCVGQLRTMPQNTWLEYSPSL